MILNRSTEPVHEIGEEKHDVFAFLQWITKGVFEIRAPKCPDRPGGNYKATSSGYFDDPLAAEEAVRALERRHPAGIYCTLNEVDESLLARSSNEIRDRAEQTTGDRDIVRRRWLFLDIDPKRPAGVSSTSSELAKAEGLARRVRDHLDGLGWTKPIFAMSGNGVYLLYRIDLPNDDASLGLVKRVLDGLGEAFDNDFVTIDRTAANASRIIKAVGTMARKGSDYQPGDKPESTHRPHRRSWFELPSAMPQPVTREQLEAVAKPEPNLNGFHPTPASGGSFDLEEWIRRHNVPVKPPRPWEGSGRKWEFAETPPLCDHDADGSGFIGQLPSGAISAGCHHDHCGWTWRDLRQHYEPGCYDDPVRPESRDAKPDERKTAPVQRYQPFPSHLLPEPLSSLVDEAAAAIGCDASYIALPLLSCVGAAVGNTVRLVVKKGWVVPPSIWTVIVGESGTAKSPAFKVAKAAIQRHQKQMLENYAAAKDQYERELGKWEEAIAAHKKSKSSEPPPKKPEHPRPVRVMVSDTTVEALAPILQSNPRGVLLQRDELSGWLGSFNQYKSAKGSDEAHWLSMFDGEAITVDRKTEGTLPTYVESALVSIAGGIQPGILAKALSGDNRANGMASRFLFAHPPRKAQKWSDDEITDETQLRVDSLFIKLLSLEFADGVSKPTFVGLSSEAKDVFRRFFDEHHEEQAELSGDSASAWSKLLGYVPRLALVFHIVEQISIDADITAAVRPDSVTKAIELIGWFKNEANRIYSTIDDTDEERELRDVVSWIERRHGNQCTPSDIVRGFRRIKNTQEAEGIARLLVRKGHAEWHTAEPGPKGGPPRRVVRVL